MSIAQIVLDLPLNKVFDYSIPDTLNEKLRIGDVVKLVFGNKKSQGVVVSINPLSHIAQLKSILAIDGKFSRLSEGQISLAYWMADYYGCSLGQAVFTILRGITGLNQESIKKSIKSTAQAYFIPLKSQPELMIKLIQSYAVNRAKVLILVPDQFKALVLGKYLESKGVKDLYQIGLRSSAFEHLEGFSLVIMLDEANESFRQEQTPLYDTKEIVLKRLELERFNLVFISSVPSIELKDLIERKKVELVKEQYVYDVKASIVDLNNYKNNFKGILSPAVISNLESNLTQHQKVILIFNHVGSFSLTKCQDCQVVLKCQRCDSPLVFSKQHKEYRCRYCPSSLSLETVCPQCHKPSWKSFGMGIEQLQRLMQDRWPNFKIHSFKRQDKEFPKGFDVLIGTQALLRFKETLKVAMVAILDFDSELNRMDFRSCFRAYSLAQDFRAMASMQFLLQTRSPDHYVIQSILKDKSEIFYQQDMQVRRELKYPPFYHQVIMQIRSTLESKSKKATSDIFVSLKQGVHSKIQLQGPYPEMILKKRDTYRMNILLQGDSVVDMIALIKQALSVTKRSSGLIVSLKVD